MAERDHPEQDPAEGSRDTIEREIERQNAPREERIDLPRPVEKGDANAQPNPQ